MMPPQPEDWGARSGASTAPALRPDTIPVYDPSTGYQSTVPPMHPQMIPPYSPPRSGSRLGWILAFIGMGLFVTVVVAVMMLARFGRRFANNVSSQTSGAVLTLQSGETPLSESNADNVLTSGNDTILTKTYPLAAGARFSIKSMNGSVVIGAWDTPSAEVKVIRRGSDRGGQVFIANDKGNLSIRTSQTGNRDIRYEIKLPRKMGRVDLSSVNGSLKLSGVTGQIVAESSHGNIELTDVVGLSKAQTTDGKITAVLREATDGPMEFTAVNGKIDLTIKSDFDANLDASTVHGSIDIDDRLGVQVEKQLVGQHARGQIGTGGPPLKITTVNGSIKLSKQQ